jgi:hypothetical protein
MTAHVNRILTTGLSHEGLSDVTEKILSIIKERFATEQPQIGPLVVKVQNDWIGLKEALTRIFRSPLTPRIVVARKRLLENLNALVLFIAANAPIDPAVYGAAAEQIGSAVREANAVTRSGKTRRDNAATSAALSLGCMPS